MTRYFFLLAICLMTLGASAQSTDKSEGLKKITDNNRDDRMHFDFDMSAFEDIAHDISVDVVRNFDFESMAREIEESLHDVEIDLEGFEHDFEMNMGDLHMDMEDFRADMEKFHLDMKDFKVDMREFQMDLEDIDLDIDIDPIILDVERALKPAKPRK